MADNGARAREVRRMEDLRRSHAVENEMIAMNREARAIRDEVRAM